MSGVFLDGEEVKFDGPSPATVPEAWSLFEGFLGESGKLIRSMLVDGVDWVPEVEIEIENYSKIEVCSWSQLENLIFSVEQVVLQGGELRSGWKEASSKVLSTDWQVFQKEAIERMDGLRPVIQVLEILISVTGSQSFEWEVPARGLQGKVNETLGFLIDAFQDRDSVRYSDLVAIDLGRMLEALFSMLEEKVLPSLKGLSEDE